MRLALRAKTTQLPAFPARTQGSVDRSISILMSYPGYHSPQFSEDPAWLPAWLQPYEHPNNRFHGKSQENGTSVGVEKCQPLQENLYKGDNAQLSTSGGAKYTSCYLHLSGDDDQQVESTSCSNAMHFCLHLSSTSVSQVLFSQYNEIPHSPKHDMNNCLSQKYVSKNPAPRLSNSQAVFKKIASCEPSSDQPIKTSQNIEHECHGKLDDGDHKSNVADDVVELSIAASEAVVISEMLFSSRQFESFSDAAIIEIALRVKHARNECMLGTSHAVSAADPDDIDHLSDLDENSMSDAFEDVGITVQQDAETSGCPFACRKSSCSMQGSKTKQQKILKSDPSFVHGLLAGDLGEEQKALPENIKDIHTGKTSFQICSLLDCKLQSLEGMTLEQEKKPHIKDLLAENQMDFMEHQCLQKVGKVSEVNNAKVKKCSKLFNWETSFLSESMDSLEQDVSQIKPSVELAIVSSSGSALQASSSSFCKEKERNHEAPLPEDYSRSLSLSDPLCSVVPCSISSGVCVDYETELPMTVMYSKCLDGNSTARNNVMLLNPFLQTRELILSETKFEQSNVPRRKQLNSLRPYSLVTDSHKNSERSNSPCKQLPLHNVYGAMVYSSGERIVECSNKNEIELPGKYSDAGETNNEQIAELNKIGVASLAIRGTGEGCEITIGGDRHRSMKRFSTPALGKYRSDYSTKKSSYRSETISKSHIPEQSNLQSFPEDKRLKRKRVRFQEVAYNMGGLKASKRQSKCVAHCSGTTMPCKSESRWDHKYDYLNSNRTLRNNEMILCGLEFLLTGFSSYKAKDLEELIRRYGGYVLPNIPSNSPFLSGKSRRSAGRKPPVILCPKKVQTTKFLYGCAVNTFILNDHWLEDSIQAGAALPLGKYITRPIPGSKGNLLINGESFWRNSGTPIFHKVGMMIHGKVKFCSKFMKIVKHGGGQVFKSLQRLVQSLKNETNTVGVILVKSESSVSRHLKHCALEHDIPTMRVSDDDIEALISNEIFQPKVIWSLSDLQVTSGTLGLTTATVKLIGSEGVERIACSVGTGPVHAAYEAVNSIVQIPVTLMEYSLNSVTEGIDAVATTRVLIRADHDGHTATHALTGETLHRNFSGSGADMDVVVSSVRAYISALNKLLGFKGKSLKEIPSSEPLVV